MACCRHGKLWLALVLLAGAISASAYAAYWALWPRGDERLREFVHRRPPVPVLFTSRSDTASFEAAAPDSEVFTYPGQRLWQAREGRLRILHPNGEVFELTWGKALPDGSTLVDVMSPAVSPDGQTAVFAGRKGGDDPGHFRLYEVGIDGSNLHALTGLAGDSGCVGVPPLRSRVPMLGSPMVEYLLWTGPAAPVNLALVAATVEIARQHGLADAERRAVDYDDVDPAYLGNGDVAFVSTRNPDLGRDHARRASNLWLLAANGDKTQVSANRNNDRWPFTVVSGHLVFSSWSRNREVIAADRRDVVPYRTGGTYATAPTDVWTGAMIESTGARLGGLVKLPFSIWRPRPLFNGHFAFMTRLALERDERGVPLSGAVRPDLLQIVQAEPGLVTEVYSARAPEDRLPRQAHKPLQFSAARDDAGRLFSLATPSPCPKRQVLLSGCAVADSETVPPGRYGIYLADDSWWHGAGHGPALLFDDPELVDAEPVAVHARPVAATPTSTGRRGDARPMAHGKFAGQGSYPAYEGPIGYVASTALTVSQNADAPGQRSDNGSGPLFHGPEVGVVDELRFYASRRDDFAHPLFPRIKGAWELIHRAPVQVDIVDTPVPAGVPFVLAGFDKAGTVAQWSTASDAEGRQARFLALAGDHYSAVRPGVYTVCTGCHPGHSGSVFRILGERP